MVKFIEINRVLPGFVEGGGEVVGTVSVLQEEEVLGTDGSTGPCEGTLFDS